MGGRGWGDETVRGGKRLWAEGEMEKGDNRMEWDGSGVEWSGCKE